ncbi:MAG: hypothetical protein V1702_01285 [Candidatus Woesearchaeota archaeon]
MPTLHERARQWVEKANKNVPKLRKKIKKKHFFIALGLIFLFIFLNYDIKAVIVVTILGLLASYSTVWKRYLRGFPSSVELLTFGTVITGIAYGPPAGFLFGFITNFAAEVISGAVDVFTFLYIFLRGIIGVVAYYLYFDFHLGIVAIGVISAAEFTFMTAPFYLLPGDAEAKLKVYSSFFISLGMNFIFFTVLGNLVLNFVLQ